MENKSVNIFGIKINNFVYSDLNDKIIFAIQNAMQISITYATADSLNQVYNNDYLTKIFQQFDYIHSDGTGIFLASKILYGKDGFKKRITGSDFYPILIRKSIECGWKIFLFGDRDETLLKAVTGNNQLKICGVQNGFDFKDEDVIKKINESGCDILIVGLGCPKQEKWISENRDRVSPKVILAVGDGIKVFAGIKKRGGKLIRISGLEWFIRLLNDPIRMWQRYLIGIPLFLYRVLKQKFLKD